MMSARVRQAPTTEAAASDAAQFILQILRAAVEKRGSASIALSGGSSPKALFSRLAAAKFDWNGVHFFWVDERAVPPGDADSNYRLARELLLEPARIPHRQIHRIQAELEPEEAARRYLAEMRSFFGLSAADLPHFDVVHLGVGPDGHTASLFPDGPLLADRSGIAAAVYVEKLKSWRITLLPGVLLAAGQIVFFAPGEEKREILQRIWGPEYNPARWPAQLIDREGKNVAWFADRAAAEGIADC